MHDRPLVFLDSSVLFSAVKSSLGGSHRIVTEAERKTIQCVISQRMVKEVQVRLEIKKRTRKLVRPGMTGKTHPHSQFPEMCPG